MSMENHFLKLPHGLFSFIFKTHPPTPSLNSKGRGAAFYLLKDFTLPLLFKGRVGMG
jgi:hypothetical protein